MVCKDKSKIVWCDEPIHFFMGRLNFLIKFVSLVNRYLTVAIFVNFRQKIFVSILNLLAKILKTTTKVKIPSYRNMFQNFKLW